MHDIPLKVSEDSVNLPRHLLHSTLHQWYGGDGLGHLYIHYTSMVTTVVPVDSVRSISCVRGRVELNFNLSLSLMLSSTTTTTTTVPLA